MDGFETVEQTMRMMWRGVWVMGVALTLGGCGGCGTTGGESSSSSSSGTPASSGSSGVVGSSSRVSSSVGASSGVSASGGSSTGTSFNSSSANVSGSVGSSNGGTSQAGSSGVSGASTSTGMVSSSGGVGSSAGGSSVGASSGVVGSSSTGMASSGAVGSSSGAVGSSSGGMGSSGGGGMTCRVLPPLSQGVCELTAGDNARLITGNILLPDGNVLEGGQVFVDTSGIIQCVGCDCATATGAATASQLSCPQGVVSPGLINAHDHITYTRAAPFNNTGERYESRHDWRRGLRGHTAIPATGNNSTQEVQWGELRFVMGGATAALSEGSVPGLMRNLDASGRSEGLSGPVVQTETFPLDDITPIFRNGDCNYGTNPDTASSISPAAYAGHVSEGVDFTSRNEFLCLSNTVYDVTPAGLADDLVLPQSSFVHSMPFAAGDYAMMARDGTSVIWSPRSNVCLYGDTAMVTAAARLGVNIALGTDWTITGSINMLRELACADELNRNQYGGFFSDVDLWRMATRNVADAVNLSTEIGQLAVGRKGDIAIFNGATNAAHRAIIAAQPQDVTLVLRGGVALYGDDALVGGLRANCDTINVCGVGKRACVQPEFSTSFAALQGANSGSYGLFFCGTPTNEPTCVPSRSIPVNNSSTYTGIPDPQTDPDGDGILNANDNCPTVFNPIRPVDDGFQGDVDGDGVGDACDPCPIEPNATSCTRAASDNDLDSDGIPNAQDNCPYSANFTQADSDNDQKGDRCDPCPTPNPGAQACGVSIRDIKNGTVGLGTTVTVANSLVTGRQAQGFFLQMMPGDPGYMDENFSGIFVFAPTNTVATGQRVTVTAAVQDFGGQIQLGNVAGVTVDNPTPEAPPTPVTVTAAEVTTGGTRATQLEGVVVSVTGPLTVAAVDTPFSEFIVDNALRVDDYLFLLNPFPTIGETFQGITGVLALRNGNSKVLPRDAGDIVTGPPVLTAFGPPGQFVYAGDTSVPTVPQALTVTFNRPVPMDTFVTVDSSNTGAVTVAGGGVTVQSGQTQAVVLLDALTAGNSTLTATFGATSLQATVTVLDASQQPVVTALEPATADLLVGGTQTLTVRLDIPAPMGGQVVNLSLNPANAGTIPATVTVPGGQLSATFDYVDGSMVTSATVTATLGASMASSTITLLTSLGTLVINEVDYDMVGTDTAEFVELFNGSGAALNMADYTLVLINGSNNSVYRTIPLGPAGTLPAGGYLVIGAAAVTAQGTGIKYTPPTADWPATDAVQNGAPDGVLLLNTATTTVTDRLSYEGAITVTLTGTLSAFGMVNLVEGTASAAADSNSVVGSLARLPNGTDTDNADTDWAFTATVTPGAPNQ